MKLLLVTHSDNEEYNADCDYAIVDLTPEFAQRILERLELYMKWQKDDRDLNQTEFWCYHATFVSNTLGEHESTIEDIVSDLKQLADGVYLLDGHEISNPKEQATECDQLVFTGRDDALVFFDCYPKHCDFKVATDYLPLALIKAAAKGEPYDPPKK